MRVVTLRFYRLVVAVSPGVSQNESSRQFSYSEFRVQHFYMGDAGEGLVDADARIQERMEELEAERRRRSNGVARIDPEKARQVESLKLARLNLSRQAEAVSHPIRKQQIQLAIAEIDKRLAAL
ncbi:MAG TPA: hypothetical protein VJ813_17255 [Vicinamibacterales bacterium]|nr:hypothetical protein [Vicinamibacterales bacterium]